MATAVNFVQETKIKKQLLASLLEAVKLCQSRFGSRSELATEQDSCVKKLCIAFESVFLHGLKSLNNGSSRPWQFENIVQFQRQVPSTFWPLIKSQLSTSEQDRFKNQKTDLAKARSWLRASINEHSLERYILMILSIEDLNRYYEAWAFLSDGEMNSLLPQAAAGLQSILFALSLDASILELDNGGIEKGSTEKLPEAQLLDNKPQQNEQNTLGSSESTSRKKAIKKKKKIPTTFVSFDNDELPKSPIKIRLPSVETENSDARPVDNAEQAESNNVEQITPPSSEDRDSLNCCSSVDSFYLEDYDLSVVDEPNSRLKPVGSPHFESDLIPILREDSVSVASTSETPQTSATTPMDLTAEMFKLRTILDHEIEQVTTLRAELANQSTQANDKLKMYEIKIEGLERENEILKHQLRLRAMLKKTSFDEGTIEDTNPSGDDNERKLIQVAEMHGELMEFNNYLQTVLKSKEAEIDKLKTELVELRGPEPPPVSDRVLINIWIPSVFLTGASNDLHHVYQVFVRIKDVEWNVYRRYSQFYTLHQQHKHVQREGLYFPPKRRNNKESRFVEERRRALQEYLRCLINHLLSENRALGAHPEKSLLISLMPFFGEQNKTQVRQKKTRFFRSDRPVANSTFHSAYTGL